MIPRILLITAFILLASGQLRARGGPQQYGPPVPLDSTETGAASYYADRFEGRPTASGERFVQLECTAAHLHLPFGSVVRVTNLANGREVLVRVNDRGPFKEGRIIDLSRSAAEALGMLVEGVVQVRLELIRLGG
jgi:rare lipoprotein A